MDDMDGEDEDSLVIEEGLDAEDKIEDNNTKK